MTGDGVNDVLALKEADCSIAMSTGSDATKNVSQLVLLDSNFSSMPEIVKEGRRTINNIERSASLFIFIKMPYPFIPIQLTLASVSTIGIPSFILSFEPNNERVTGKFLPNVLKKAVPPAITIVINILIIIIISSILKLTYTQTSTLSVLMTGYTSFILLFKVCQPFNMMRKCLFGSMFLLFVFGIVKLKTIFSLFFISLDFITSLFFGIYVNSKMDIFSKDCMRNWIDLSKLFWVTNSIIEMSWLYIVKSIDIFVFVIINFKSLLFSFISVFILEIKLFNK